MRVALVVGFLAAVALTAACRSETGDKLPKTTSTSGGPIAGDRFEVSGTLTQLAAERALTDPIAPPFTITVAARGVGGGEILNATVNGKRTQINWGAGQPLPVRGSGPGLDLNIVSLGIDDSGTTIALDGAARDFRPGVYTLGSAVAIGAGGLATPVDSVTFTAADNTTLSTRGGAAMALPRRAIRIEGTDGALTMVGTMTLRSPTEDRAVANVTFGPGTYEVTLTPADRGYRVTAKLAGKVTA